MGKKKRFDRLAPGANKENLEGPRWLRDDGKLVGRGGFGEAYLVEGRTLVRRGVSVVGNQAISPGKEYVVKWMKESTKLSVEQLQQIVAKQDHVAGHRNVITPLGVVETLRVVVQDYGGGFNIGWFTKKLGFAYKKHVVDSIEYWGVYRHLVRQVLEGLAHIHTKRLTHRDVKFANITVDDRGKVSIIDLDLLTPLETTGGLHGTHLYRPEHWDESDPATRGVDLYALGVMLRGTWTAHRPGVGRLEMSQLYMRPPEVRSASDGGVHSEMMNRWKNLVSCLELSGQNRITATQLLRQHEFFQPQPLIDFSRAEIREIVSRVVRKPPRPRVAHPPLAPGRKRQAAPARSRTANLPPSRQPAASPGQDDMFYTARQRFVSRPTDPGQDDMFYTARRALGSARRDSGDSGRQPTGDGMFDSVIGFPTRVRKSRR